MAPDGSQTAQSGRRRVFIRGVGVVSGAGIGNEAFAALLAAPPAPRAIAAFDPAGFPCRHGFEARGEGRDVDVKRYVPKGYRKATKVMARDSDLAVVAAQVALRDAGVRTRGSGDSAESATDDSMPMVAGGRLGCHIGAGLIAAETDELSRALATSRDESGRFSMEKWGTEPSLDGSKRGAGGMNSLPPLWMLKYLPNMLACHVTIIHGAEGPSNTLTNAEASGVLCVGESARVIERGDADICLSGGAESKLNLMGHLRQTLAGRLAATEGMDDAAAAAAVRPLVPEGAGYLPGEGGAIFVLEGEGSGIDGPPGGVLGGPAIEVLGFGAGQTPRVIEELAIADPAAGSVAEPDAGLVRAIRAALRDAAVGPEEIDAVLPAALGIGSADAAERAAIASVFGDVAFDGGAGPAIAEITTRAGGCSAGHSALQVAAAVLSLRGGSIHAMPGGRSVRVRTLLVCSGSLSGQAGALVLRRGG